MNKARIDPSCYAVLLMNLTLFYNLDVWHKKVELSLRSWNQLRVNKTNMYLEF